MDISFGKQMETPETLKEKEQIEMQILNDETFEPAAYVEQIGDYAESETIQTELTVIMQNSTGIVVEQSTPMIILESNIPAVEGASSETVSIPGPGQSEVSSSPVPQPVPEPAAEISSSLADQVQVIPGPLPQPSLEVEAQKEEITSAKEATIASQVPDESMVQSISGEATSATAGTSESVLDTGTSQLKETLNVGEVQSPGTMSETSGEREIKIESSAMTSHLVENTMAGLVDKQEFAMTYQAQGVVLVETKIIDSAVSILSRNLVTPGLVSGSTDGTGNQAGIGEPVGGVTPEGEEGTQPPPPAGDQTGSENAGTESTGETGEEWVPPEMYFSRDAEGNITVVDANGKPVNSPPMIITIGETTYGYYHDVLGKDGTPIKFEIDAFKGYSSDIYYYINQQGKMVAVDRNGKMLECQPMIRSESGEPPYYAFFPGAYDENGNPIKVEMKCYIGPINDISVKYEQDGEKGVFKIYNSAGELVAIYGEDDLSISEYAGLKGFDSDGVNVTSYYSDFYCYIDKNGNAVAVDANGKPLDSPPVIVQSGLDDPPYYAYYPYAINQYSDRSDERGHWQGIKIPVYAYQGSQEEVYFFRDAQGNLTIVDANGKPIESPPIIKNSYTGEPPYPAYYQNVYDKDGKPLQIEIQQYMGPIEALFYYRDSQGNLTIVDVNGKPVESPPTIVQSLDGTTTISASYPGVYDENGNLIKIEIQQFKGTAEEMFYYRDSNGNLTVVDANGKPVDSPPKIVQAPDGLPPFTAFYPGVYDDKGNLLKIVIQPYKPQSNTQAKQGTGTTPQGSV